MFDPAASNQLVTVNSAGTGPGSGSSYAPAFSPDGRWVVFQSDATNLTTNSTTTFSQLYARNLTTKKTRSVSYETNGAGVLGQRSENAGAFSADSRFVFYFTGTVDGSYGIYRHDLIEGGPNLFCGYGRNPSANADGRLVVYEALSPGVILNDIRIVDLVTGQSRLVTVSTNGVDGANRRSFNPILSHDGHYVVFSSLASNLVPGDSNGTRDVFVRDLWAGNTMLASMNQDGTGSGNALSTLPLLAANGRTVFFQSFASDLAPGDFNNTRDIFSLELGGPDTDGDGLDDDWEVAYFSTLARDGRGDFDGDGLTDAEEFRAGTNPAEGSSVLRVLTVSSWNDGGRRLIWSASPGRRYRAEFKNSVSDVTWTDLAGDVVAAGTTACKLDPTPESGGRRFYRVVLLP